MTYSSSSLPYWLATLYLPSIGLRTLRRWLEYFPTIENLFNATVDEWTAAGLSGAHQALLKNPDWRAVEKDLAWAMQPDHHLLSIDDTDYPPLLKETADAPFILFVQGQKHVLLRTQLAMVGSRHPSAQGLMNAEQFASAFAEKQIGVTSGLALGIDGASHRGALAAKGITIGVAGTGLNHLYPSAHLRLAEDIVKEGALVSEFPLNMPPQAMNFPRRNRIISGLSIGVLVVEAALKSGSLITARFAVEQGRDVFAIPGSIHQPQAKGCHFLIQQGAKLVESAEDILSEIGSLASYTKSSGRAATYEKLNEIEQKILLAINYETTPVDMILFHNTLTAGELSSILLTLELYGYIKSVPGGYVRLNANQ